MQGVSLLFLSLAMFMAPALCDDPKSTYFPEEEGLDIEVDTGLETEVGAEDIKDDEPQVVTETNDKEASTFPPSRCYYYCAYDGEVYCCGDDSQPIPENHDPHDGLCAEEHEQICKSTGVFYYSKKLQARTSGAIRLVNGPGKKQPTCASDGYCKEDERCCPSHCARKHICMKSLPIED